MLSNEEEGKRWCHPVIEGWQFVATLQLRTPLHVLLHHGEMFYGPPEEAPKYGEWSNGYSKDGTWVPKSKTWRQLAIESGGDVEFATKADECTKEGAHASDIGYALPNEYVPFLIEFRRIYESDKSEIEKIGSIKKLAEVSPIFRKIFSKLAEGGSGFPESFFPKKQVRRRRL